MPRDSGECLVDAAFPPRRVVMSEDAPDLGLIRGGTLTTYYGVYVLQGCNLSPLAGVFRPLEG